MSEKDEVKLLAKSLSACGQRIESLQYSLSKNRSIFPLDLAGLSALSEEQKESIDAMILRYSQCVSMIQDQLFKGILLVEQEDIASKSNRDKTLLIEKLGVIKSANEFSVATVLRNKFAYFYPEESNDQLNKLNTLVNESTYVIGVFTEIHKYVSDKNLINTNRNSLILEDVFNSRTSRIHP